jgi:hypothetical protein
LSPHAKSSMDNPRALAVTKNLAEGDLYFMKSTWKNVR